MLVRTLTRAVQYARATTLASTTGARKKGDLGWLESNLLTWTYANDFQLPRSPQFSHGDQAQRKSPNRDI
jgi:hypothetical protein